MRKRSGLAKSLINKRNAVQDANESNKEDVATEHGFSPHLSNYPEQTGVLSEKGLTNGSLSYSIIF